MRARDRRFLQEVVRSDGRPRDRFGCRSAVRERRRHRVVGTRGPRRRHPPGPGLEEEVGVRQWIRERTEESADADEPIADPGAQPADVAVVHDVARPGVELALEVIGQVGGRRHAKSHREAYSLPGRGICCPHCWDFLLGNLRGVRVSPVSHRVGWAYRRSNAYIWCGPCHVALGSDGGAVRCRVHGGGSSD